MTALTKEERDYVISVLERLIAQGCCAIERSFCRYRTKDGKKCAAGMDIPDEIYESNFEGTEISALLENVSSLKQYFPFINLTTILQQIHDDASRRYYYPVNYFKELLSVIISNTDLTADDLKKFNCNIPIPTEFNPYSDSYHNYRDEEVEYHSYLLEVVLD